MEHRIAQSSTAGFTLIEFLIVISITIILATASFPLYGNLHVSSELSANTAYVAQMIRTARVRSVAGLDNATHGVYFETNTGTDDRVILFQGGTYGERSTAYDQAFELDAGFELTTSLTNQEVVFAKGTGTPSHTGTVTLTQDVTGNTIITINSFGIVDAN